jgi:putative membrane protein insertion efficiency factor
MIRRGLLGLVRFYSRAISPALPARCRFYPTCSAYAAEAIERHGAGRGTWLALRRLLKCAPWHPGGVDLVPGTRTDADASSTSGLSAASPSAAGRARTDRTIPPVLGRANEESSVA